MADLASGAVGTLLGAIREETKLLGGVRGDLQFIKDEMESMKSFLQHLNKKKHRGREHDEPVRKWMNQVREVANDCSDCIDLYRTRDGLWRRHGWWIPGFVLEMVAQHRAANRLQELKARARDVGERRARYGVEVPQKKKIKEGALLLEEDEDEEEEEEEDEYVVPATTEEEEPPHGRRRAFLEALLLLEEKKDSLSEVVEWTLKIKSGQIKSSGMPSIAIMAPPKDMEAVARALDAVVVATRHFEAMVCIDIRASDRPLRRPLDILLYMLLKIRQFQYDGGSNKKEENTSSIRQGYYRRPEVRDNIDEIWSRITHIQNRVLKEMGLHIERQSPSTQSLRLLLGGMRILQVFPLPDVRDIVRYAVLCDEKKIFEETARELNNEFALHYTQCEHILREVFFPPASSAQLTEYKMDEIATKIEEQLEIRRTVERIGELLQRKRTLLILLDDQNYACPWEETRNALSNLLPCAADSAMMVITAKSIQEAKHLCYPPHNPIRIGECSSLVDLYHDIVLKFTRQRQEHTNGDNYNPQIFRDILDKCHPHEFCMKMFAHAMYANPNRRDKELRMLHASLLPVSQQKTSLGRNAEKMFMFSYNDLPKEYKSCLLYLAIFPQGQSIRRSTLVGRWITEGLIDSEDWPTAVCQVERCFDALVDWWLVSPVDLGAAGKVKSCMVANQVHKFITKIAKEERIMETRLPHHLARHLSIFSNLRLRDSDRIQDFLQQLSGSSRLLLFKMLDLQDCQCFRKNQRYIKDICNNILLLKYLSLRGTIVTSLPKEINNLHDLEILDIRETKVHGNATSNILMRKLKRLLAGGYVDDTSPSNYETHTETSVRIPYRIDKMANMEILLNVRVSKAVYQELKNIGKLHQLRRLCIAIDDKEDHLKYFIQAINELHECLRSLSITLHTQDEGTNTSSRESPDLRYFQSPVLLESLGINGVTERVQLLPLLAKGSKELAKVTLSCTSLNQGSLSIIPELPKLLCVRLRHKGYTQDEFIFKKNEFQSLKYFLVEGQNMTEITFEDGAAPELEKIVLSFTNISNLSGVERLPKLKEVELNGNNSSLLSLFDSAHQIAKVTLRGTLLKEGDLQILAKKPNLRCLVLLDKSFEESQLTFKKGEFSRLNLLIVNCSSITSIHFSPGTVPWLRKIVWSFTKMESLSGINTLWSLKELELNGELIPNEVKDAIRYHENMIDFKHKKPHNQDGERGREAEKGEDSARFPLLCWKSRG